MSARFNSLALVVTGAVLTLAIQQVITWSHYAPDQAASYGGGDKRVVGTWKSLTKRGTVLVFSEDGEITLIHNSGTRMGRWRGGNNSVSIITDYEQDCPVGEPPPPKYQVGITEIKLSADGNRLEFTKKWDHRYDGVYARLQ